ncbi:hypothetical protein [Salinisphaera japonica]|uniref:hypothetical protein n=1 Tax=Salinisphaera japonica TaxID=1304270 RepID=UPI001C84305C|nr:hypothetical protein [Salinisphaera japonica]
MLALLDVARHQPGLAGAAPTGATAVRIIDAGAECDLQNGLARRDRDRGIGRADGDVFRHDGCSSASLCDSRREVQRLGEARPLIQEGAVEESSPDDRDRRDPDPVAGHSFFCHAGLAQVALDIRDVSLCEHAFRA